MRILEWRNVNGLQKSGPSAAPYPIFTDDFIPFPDVAPILDVDVLDRPQLNSMEVISCTHSWELALGSQVIDECAARLVLEAKYLQAMAIGVLQSYFEWDKEHPVNLGMVVRHRADLLGPRITWVKFRGRSRASSTGQRYTPTEPLKMQGRYQYSSIIFKKFPVEIRVSLEILETKAAWIRFRTERLARLRDLCRETETLSKKTPKHVF